MNPPVSLLKYFLSCMADLFLSYKNSRIASHSFGSGKKPVLCIHGYGETAESFAFLEKYAGNDYKFYALELPFHGQTEWKEGLNFAVDDLMNILQEITELKDKQFTLMGFSLGGRVALSLYEAIPQRIEKLILLAPDGLTVNFWYWLTTQTIIGNKLFRFTMNYPHWFFLFLKFFNKIGVVNASVFKFVNFYIGNTEVRDQLYQRWTTFRKLKPSLKKIKLQISGFQTPVKLIYGKYDRIILPSRGKRFQKGIENYCSLVIIPSGHHVLHENHVKEILSALRINPGQ